jgi:hypothetical protein
MEVVLQGKAEVVDKLNRVGGGKLSGDVRRRKVRRFGRYDLKFLNPNQGTLTEWEDSVQVTSLH